MRRIVFLFCAAFFTFSPYSFGQNPQTGFPPFSSFQSTGFDAVDEQNLNAIFSISISSTPARGQGFQYNLVNNSLLWTQTGGSPNAWTPVTDASGNPTWGWNYGPAVAGAGQLRGGATGHVCRYIDPDTGFWAFASYSIYQDFSYKDWRGTVHPFNVVFVVTTPSAQANCAVDSTPLPVSGYSTDNTGFLLTVNAPGNYTVLSPAGVNAGAAPVDSNGNYVSQTVVSSTETDWTDTAGHVALKVFKNSTNIQHEWQDSSGNYTAATTTVQLSTLNIKTNFACSGITEYTGTASLPTEVDLPTGQKYLITYEPTPGFSCYYTGRVQRVTFPTGGYYEYDYPTSAGDGIACADSTVNSLTRLINDGTNTSTWAFSRSPSGSNWVTTVTAPQMPYDGAANNAVYTFNSSGQQISAQFYQGPVSPANLKRTVNTTWSGGAPATQITILEDRQTENEVETSFDSYGNILTLKEHDWGTNAPGSILRTTTWTYLNSSPYISANILNRPTRVTVADSGGTVHSRTDIAYDESGYGNYTCVTGAAQHNDANFGCSFTTRGNPTTITTYTNAATPSGSITHHSYYDSVGNLVRADLDCCQSKTWSFSATTQYSFPDFSTRGSSPGTQLTTSATYNAYTGLVATSTDENSQVTHFTFDNLKRLTNVQRPDNTNLTWTYNDATPPTQSSVTAGVPTQGSSVQKTITTVDGLGRAVAQQITDGTTTYSIVATQYDPLGRRYMASNPYTSSPQYWTTAQFDALGRATKSILPDNSQTTFSFATNTATVTDPAGKARKSVVDGLGRMTSMWEPDPNNGNSLSLQTTYAYNVLDLLTSVAQGAQSRTYTFDDIGRPTSVKAPETNQTATQFQYNNFGLVTQRADARGVVTTYGYDTFNRLQSLSYNVGSTGVPSTSSVSFTYGTSSTQNNNGRLITMTDGVGSENYSFDTLGNMTQLQKVISGTTYTTSYQYNLAGELTQITYPSGRAVLQNYDSIGRLCAVGAPGSSCSSGTTYASGFSYNPAFQVTGLNYGNGVAATFGYTPDRLLLQSLAYTKGSSTLFSTNYWYKTDSTNCPSGAAGNNGQIQCITDNVDSGRTVSYSYDALYRLSSAVTNGSTNYPKWGLSWTYDRYGNRTAQTVTAGSAYSNSVTVNTSTNQIVGPPYAYDANGNMTNDGSNTLVYDAENRLLSATNGSSSGSYFYDGKNLRVKKVSGSTTTVYIFSGSRAIAEYDNGVAVGSPSREYVYSGSHLLARIDSSGTKYYHQDHLSNRLVTDSSGNTLEQLGTYPYGDSWYNGTNDKLFFTSYERDSESGNDYAMMRFGVNRLGRFSSPDPLSGSKGNPQSLNHYAYVHNDPVNSVDPTGLGGHPYYYCGGDNVSTSYCSGGEGLLNGGGGGGMSCSYQPGQPCVIMGLEIFDAIAGAAGTYLHFDIYGNMGFGFSTELYTYAANQGPGAATKSGWTYSIQDTVTGPIATGFVADAMVLQQQNAQLAAQLPLGAINDMLANVGVLRIVDINNGQPPQPMQNYFWQAIGDYLQGNGLDMSLQLPLYQNLWGLYELSISPANPLNRP